jgi:hypothetical protein
MTQRIALRELIPYLGPAMIGYPFASKPLARPINPRFFDNGVTEIIL